MENEFGLKELYDLTLKATYPIEMGGRKFEVGEVIARFDKIQLANFQEITSRISAKGGYHNAARIIWEDPKEIQLFFTQGIFSKQQFTLLSNSRALQVKQNEPIWLAAHYSGESDEEGKIKLESTSIRQVFVYKVKTGEKIKPLEINLEKGELVIGEPYIDVEIDYEYPYLKGAYDIVLGQKLISGFLRLEGKTRVKDDITGKTRTAVLRIPRLKLISDLSMRLGREANPVLAKFSAIGLPVMGKRPPEIMEMLFLNDDIDADM